MYLCTTIASSWEAAAVLGQEQHAPSRVPCRLSRPLRPAPAAGAGELRREAARAAGPGESGAAGKDRGRTRMCRICKRFCHKLIRLCIELDIGECVHLRQKISVRINPRAGIIYKYT